MKSVMLLLLILILCISICGLILYFIGYRVHNKCENPECSKCPFPICKNKKKEDSANENF